MESTLICLSRSSLELCWFLLIFSIQMGHLRLKELESMKKLTVEL